MSNPGDTAKGGPEVRDRGVEPGAASSAPVTACASRIRSIYCPTVEETVHAVFDLRSRFESVADSLFEVPADQYHEVVRRIGNFMEGSGPEYALPEPDETRRLKRGTVTYRQALRLARSGRIDGVTFDTETRAIRCDFAYGLSFATEHASARWAGGTERAAVAMALYLSLKAGPGSAVYGLLAARLAPTGQGSMKSVRTRGALYGVAGSPLGQGATVGYLRALSSMTGPAGTGPLVLLSCAGPLASTVAIGVGNLDFYRAALERSISWTQFTKNTVIQATGIVVGTGGWAGGAVLGATLGGPVCALIGGIAGALSAGGLGAVGAKRIADRIVEDDAMRSMAIVRERSEQLAFDYLLTTEEIDRFATRIKDLVDTAWLRRMFRIGHKAAKSNGGDRTKLLRRFVDRELDKICREIVARRARTVLPRASVVDVLLQETRLLDFQPRLDGPDPLRAGANSRLSKIQSGATL